MKKDFDKWNILKKDLQKSKNTFFFHEREIWWCSVGVNIGFEQDGRSDTFERPVLIIKKFNQDIFLGLPMTSAQKEGMYYQKIQHKDRNYTIVLSQIRLFDRKRLQRKIRILSKKEFEEVIHCFKRIL
ncbi:MAG: type II toxin-antitoxin system PemK/MazF family toxin [Candidatus Paceibacterota bacterium]